MIKIEKGKAPEFLSSEKVEIARERMRTFYASNREQNRVGGKRSSFLPTFVFRPLTPPRMRFRTWRFFI